MSEETAEPVKQIPCLHDPRRYVNVMPLFMSPDALRTATKFFPTCPYKSMPGSIYCYPHTVLNGGVQPAISREISEWIRLALKYYASGLAVGPVMPDGQMTFPTWWPHRFN